MSSQTERAGEMSPRPAYQPLVALAAALAAGVVVDRFWPLRVEVWWLSAAVVLGVWLVAWRKNWTRTAAVFLLIATATLGAARHHLHWSVFAADDLGRVADHALRPVCMEAVALENPRWRPAPIPTPLATFERGDLSKFDVRLIAVRDGRQWRRVSGKAELAVHGHLLGVRAGDRLWIAGQFQRPQPPLNPGEFDFSAQQRAERKLARILVDHPDAVKVLARGSWWRPRRLLHAIRDRGDALLWRHVGTDRAGLASTLVLGSREQVDRERLEPFFVTGVMHALAISGMHLVILLSGFWLVLRTGWIRRRTALAAAMALAFFYALLTGFQPPVVRAAILVIVLCVGKFMGRPILAFNTLAAAALVVLALNPAELFDTGAQLSFLAVGVLTWIGPRVAKWARPPADPLDRLIMQTRPWPKRVVRAASIHLAQLLAASLAVWVAVLPLVMYRFHVVPPAAILLNLLLVLPVSLALFSGFGVVMIGELFPPLASLCGALCDTGLAAMEWMIGAAQHRFDLHFWTPGPARWWVLATNAGMAAWATFPHRRPSRRWTYTIVAAWLALGLAPPDHGFDSDAEPTSAITCWPTNVAALTPGPSRSQQFHCTFIAVGHGVSVLIELPDGRTLLYDAGSLGPPTSGARSIAAVLWSRGLRHLDAVVISHADLDHYNALPELLEYFSVGAVYVSPLMFDDPTPALTALRSAITETNTPLREIVLGDRLLSGGGVMVETLHPPRRGVAGNDNANSVVLHVEAWGRRVLLPGDLEGGALADLLDEEPRDYDVVLAPHHGSRRSNPPGFATWATPEATVISGALSDISEDVEAAYRAVGSRVYHTAKDGAVRATLRPDGVFVQTWRERKRN